MIDIYSIGSFEFLADIFMGLALIFGYTSGGIGAHGMIMFLTVSAGAGVLTQVFSGMMSGQGFNGGNALGKLITFYFVFLLLFGASADVRVRDVANPGNFRDVDDVPAGVAYTASFMTKAGSWVTHKFLEAWPGPSQIATGDYDPYVNAGFLSSLKVVTNLKNMAYNKGIENDISVLTTLVDPYTSMNTYFEQCTIKGMHLGAVDINQTQTGAMPGAIRYDNDLLTVEFTTVGGPVTQSCTGAWAYMGADDSSDGVTSIYEALGNLTANGREAALKSLGATTSNNYDATTGVFQLTEADTSGDLKNISHRMSEIGVYAGAAGNHATSAQRILFGSLVGPIYEYSLQEHASQFDFNAALMINSAIAQRNTQWAGEQSLFMSIVRPMSAFCEAFIYAATPFMAGMVLMGFGIRLLGKWLQFTLSIQLWTATLIIIDRYMRITVTRDLARYTEDAAVSIDSFYVLNGIQGEVETYVATGGALAAMTPSLTMLLVLGSPYVMSSIAQRMGGKDHIDEKIVSPDPIKAAPVLENASQFSSNRVYGTHGTGTPATAMQFSQGTFDQQTVQSASQYQQSTSEAFNSMVGKEFATQTSASHSRSMATDYAQSMRASDSQSYDTMHSTAQNFIDTYDVTGVSAEQLVGAMGAQVSAGVNASPTALLNLLGGKAGKAIPGTGGDSGSGPAKHVAPGVNLTASAQGSVTGQTSVQDSEKHSDSTQWQEMRNLAEKSSASYSNEFAESIRSNDAESWSQGFTDSERESFSSAASEMLQASQSYSAVSNAGNVFGSQVSTDSMRIAQNLDSSERGDLNRNFNTVATNMSAEDAQSLRDEQRNLSRLYTSPDYDMTSEQATSRSQIESLANRAHFGHEESKDASVMAQQAVMKSIGDSTGRDTSGLGFNSERNAGLQSETGGGTGTRDTVNGAVSRSGSVQGAVGSNVMDPNNAPLNPVNTNAHYQSARGNVDAAHNDAHDAMHDKDEAWRKYESGDYNQPGWAVQGLELAKEYLGIGPSDMDHVDGNYNQAQRYYLGARETGLTDAQSMVYATSNATGVGVNSAREEAKEAFYAEQNIQNETEQQRADMLYANITEAADAGKWGVNYLASVGKYNTEAGYTTPSDSAPNQASLDRISDFGEQPYERFLDKQQPSMTEEFRNNTSSAITNSITYGGEAVTLEQRLAVAAGEAQLTANDTAREATTTEDQNRKGRIADSYNHYQGWLNTEISPMVRTLQENGLVQTRTEEETSQFMNSQMLDLRLQSQMAQDGIGRFRERGLDIMGDKLADYYGYDDMEQMKAASEDPQAELKRRDGWLYKMGH